MKIIIMTKKKKKKGIDLPLPWKPFRVVDQIKQYKDANDMS